jgi:hypothetical protein
MACTHLALGAGAGSLLGLKLFALIPPVKTLLFISRPKLRKTMYLCKKKQQYVSSGIHHYSCL